jgi:hypothetical protein
MTSIIWKILLGSSIIMGVSAVFIKYHNPEELQIDFLISIVLALWAIAFKIK